MRVIFCLLIIASLVTGCEQIAVISTPPKKPEMSHTQLAMTARENFWHTLHTGNYQHLPQTIHLLTAAYLQKPQDPNLAAYLGFAHIWKIAERQREKNIPPTIVDHMILSKQYFLDAVKLNPQDARLQGFLGVTQLASGKIFADDREQVRGYFQLKYAIHQWPAFNYFTAGYPMSVLEPKSDHFKEALDWQWNTLSICAGRTINKNHPNFSFYMNRETQEGPLRACWNSWIAPHNFEGFFMNMGDMLVKSGDWQTAIRIYQNAKLSTTYNTWPYRHLLENRIQQARKNVVYFNEANQQTATKRMMFDSGYGCVVCHQR